MSSSSDESDPSRDYSRRKLNFRPRINEKVFKRSSDKISEYLKNNPDITTITVLDITIFHRDRFGSCEDRVKEHVIDNTCRRILEELVNSNVVHLNLTSDWKNIKSLYREDCFVCLENFTVYLEKFVSINNTLHTIDLRGVKFETRTKDNLKRFVFGNPGNLKILADFLNDFDISKERIKFFKLIILNNVYFNAVFGTMSFLNIDGSKDLTKNFNNVRILITDVSRYNESSNYTFIIENTKKHGNIIRTLGNGEVEEISIVTDKYYRIYKEFGVYMCEVQILGRGRMAPSTTEYTIPLSKFSFETIRI